MAFWFLPAGKRSVVVGGLRWDVGNPAAQLFLASQANSVQACCCLLEQCLVQSWFAIPVAVNNRALGIQHSLILSLIFSRHGLKLVGAEIGFPLTHRRRDQSYGVSRAVLCLLQHDSCGAATEGKNTFFFSATCACGCFHRDEDENGAHWCRNDGY